MVGAGLVPHLALLSLFASAPLHTALHIRMIVTLDLLYAYSSGTLDPV